MSKDKSRVSDLASKLIARRQYDKAVGEYQKLLKTDPNDIRTWLRLGELYERMGARKEATDTFLYVADHYMRIGFHLKAVAVYKKILEYDPMMGSVYEMLVNCYVQMGWVQDALTWLDQLVDVASRLGNATMLLTALIRIVEIEPTNLAARIRLAELLAQEQRTDEAVAQFAFVAAELKQQGRIDDFLRIAEHQLFYEPDNLELSLEVIRLHLDRGAAQKALDRLQKCLAKHKHDERVLSLLADAFLSVKQPEKAVSVYEEMAKTAQAQNRTPDRLRYLQSILEIDPHPAEARQALNAAVTHTLRDSAAVSAAPRSPPAARREGSALKNIPTLLEEAEVLIKYGLIDRAREHFDKIFKIDYYNSDARERLKDVLLNAGDTAGACDQLFVLAEAFRTEQPEATVYYLHQILGIDPYNQRAREELVSIGGVMPEGLPEMGTSTDISLDDSGLLSIDNNPYVAIQNKFFDDESFVEIIEPLDADDLTDLASPAAAMHLPDAGAPAGDPVYLLEDDVEDDELTVAQLAPTAPPPPLLPRPSVLPPAIPDAPPLPPPMPVAPSLPRPSMLGAPPAPPMPPSAPPAPPMPPSAPPAPPMPSSTPAAPPLPITDLFSRIPSMPADAPVDVLAEIEEIEFFLEQGLEDDARNMYFDLKERFPGDLSLLPLAEKFEQMPAPAPKPRTAPIAIVDSTEDLTLEDVTSDVMLSEVDDVFSQFKSGVDQQIAQSDWATHYDLGQAYKEMGLFDDAIGEFQLAAGDPQRRVDAEIMVGLCHVGAKRYEEALAAYDNIAATVTLSEQEQLALHYEKARTLENMGRKDDALNLYNEIVNSDPGFADVVERIDLLT